MITVLLRLADVRAAAVTHTESEFSKKEAFRWGEVSPLIDDKYKILLIFTRNVAFSRLLR